MTRPGPVARFAILRCEDADKWRPLRYRWRDLLGEPGDQWDVFNVYDAHLPAAVDEYAGYVVTGSHYSCTDPSLTWLAPLFDFLRECAVHDGAGGRVVASCFGHQAVARALGGKVGPNPGGSFAVGRETVHLHDAMRRHPLAGRMGCEDEIPQSLALLESHGDCVTGLPDGAELWAHSTTTEHEMFALNDRVLAFQGHPELSPGEVDENILCHLLKDGRVSDRQAQAARTSMNLGLDSERLLAFAKPFLRGAVKDKSG